jgi:hypothetical protein
MSKFLKNLWSILCTYQHFAWFPLAALLIFLNGKLAEWLNNGHKLLDDPSSLYSFALLGPSVLWPLFWTALYSTVLNNSLTREEYVQTDWKSKFVDNLPELIIFLAVLYCYHTKS